MLFNTHYRGFNVRAVVLTEEEHPNYVAATVENLGQDMAYGIYAYDEDGHHNHLSDVKSVDAAIELINLIYETVEGEQ